METKTSGRLHRSRPRHLPRRTDLSRNIRIMVADVLEQVESGMAYEVIIEVALRE